MNCQRSSLRTTTFARRKGSQGVQKDAAETVHNRNHDLGSVKRRTDSRWRSTWYKVNECKASMNNYAWLLTCGSHATCTWRRVISRFCSLVFIHFRPVSILATPYLLDCGSTVDTRSNSDTTNRQLPFQRACLARFSATGWAHNVTLGSQCSCVQVGNPYYASDKPTNVPVMLITCTTMSRKEVFCPAGENLPAPSTLSTRSRG